MAVMAAEGRCRNGCGAEGSEGGAACCAALAARERSRSAACAAIFLCITSLRSSATMRSSSSAFGCARLPDIEGVARRGTKKADKDPNVRFSYFVKNGEGMRERRLIKKACATLHTDEAPHTH